MTGEDGVSEGAREERSPDSDDGEHLPNVDDEERPPDSDDEGRPPNSARDDGRPDPTRCKVGRLLAQHDLEEFGAELERRWTAPDGDRESLRSLADGLNRRLLETELRDAGESPSRVEVDGFYEALTSEDADGASTTRARRDLERWGVDVESLRETFVTHQAVHTYLTEYRGASYESEPTGVDSERETLARLRSRTAAVTSSSLERLVDAGLVDERDYDPLVSVQVVCRDCGRSHDVEALLDRGGCSCELDRGRAQAASSGNASDDPSVEGRAHERDAESEQPTGREDRA